MNPFRAKHLIMVGDVILLQAADVHIPDVYSEFLAESIDLTGVETACDLTSGCGFHALCIAANGVPTVAIDKSSAAAALVARNVEINSLGALVDVRCGDLYEALSADERFDCIVAWPPVMPTPADEDVQDWWSLANSGGHDGRETLDRIIVGARRHLKPGGSLWLPQPWYISLEMTADVVAANGLEMEVVATREFPLGTVVRARLPYLASLGIKPVYQGVTSPQKLTILRIYAVGA